MKYILILLLSATFCGCGEKKIVPSKNDVSIDEYIDSHKKSQHHQDSLVAAYYENKRVKDSIKMLKTIHGYYLYKGDTLKADYFPPTAELIIHYKEVYSGGMIIHYSRPEPDYDSLFFPNHINIKP